MVEQMSTRHKLHVKKRSGNFVPVSYDAITNRLDELCNIHPILDLSIDPREITENIIKRIKNGISTSEIDNFIAEICAHNLDHPDYLVLASRIVISNHHKNLSGHLKYSESCEKLYNNKDSTGADSPVISKLQYDLSKKYAKELDSMIDLSRDYLIDFFGFRTLYRGYLLKLRSGEVVESPQHMFLRLSLFLHQDSLDLVKESYDLMSTKHFTHATPTLFNAGTVRPQLFSCFLLGMEDSIEGIFKCISDTAKISKWAGGIGIDIGDIRANGSYVRGTSGSSEGLVPMLKVMNDTARYINQGGRRKGSIAVYLEPFHADIFEFLDITKKNGPDNKRTHDLFTAMWISDLFMFRVKNDLEWSLMCPDECPNLTNVYGSEFEKLYTRYENEGRYKKKIKAVELWERIIDSQIETGLPYMLYKDAVNLKNNQAGLGTIKSSNLCCEIVEYHDTKKYACCCLASIVLPTFVENGEFDYNKLYKVVRTITRNLDKSIDLNYYPVPETEVSNFSERPLGIGVQGLSDVFFKLSLPYDSKEAAVINKKIFETIYFAALTESNVLAKETTPYKTYDKSRTAEGLLQFDLWSLKISDEMWNWTELRSAIKSHGLRNSLLTALMPTATTSHIMATTVEAFEPIMSNVYVRKVIAGDFIVFNKYLTDDLMKLGLWSKKMSKQLIKNRGSVQDIQEIPQNLKDIYKTCWEIKQKVLIDLSADRAPFIDQSQSLNLFFEKPTYNQLTSAHFYGFEKGLKTGSYYIRARPPADSESFTIIDDDDEIKPETNDDEVCDLCSS